MTIERYAALPISVILDKMQFKIERGALSIKDITPIKHKGLKLHLDAKHIPLNIAKKYLKQLYIYNKNSKNHFYALGFNNEEGGYELCNEVFRGYIDTRAISYIRGANPTLRTINVFKDAVDFMSVVTSKKEGTLQGDSIVLNTYSQATGAAAYIQKFGYKILYSWLPNTKTSLKTRQYLTELCKSEPGLQHVPINSAYKQFRTVNDWWIAHPRPNL